VTNQEFRIQIIRCKTGLNKGYSHRTFKSASTFSFLKSDINEILMWLGNPVNSADRARETRKQQKSWIRMQSPTKSWTPINLLCENRI